MREIDIDLGAVAGAVANGSEAERWFIDVANGRVFMISTLFQSDEEIERAVDMIQANIDNYIPLPYLSHEEFLDEVEMYIRTLGDSPALAKYLQQAVENKSTKDQIMQLLNRDPGKKKEFSEFYSQRVQERVAMWLDSQNIKLKEDSSR